MPERFAERRVAVVTIRAGTDDLRVVDLYDRREGDDLVAVLADIGRRNVGRQRLTEDRVAVVAAHAIAGDVVVIEIGR